jgi:uncharacterized protein involved in type VI secretion and phage assembly
VVGKRVDIQGVGNRFKGKYYVTQVLHEWNKDQGMFTRFIVSGRRERGIWSMLSDATSEPYKVGPAIGLVTNNKDPDGLGRVRVKFPWLANDVESAWARIVAPMAGKERGFMFLPEVDDEVMVIFEHGDIQRPSILGGIWNGVDKPPLDVNTAVGGDGLVNKRIIKSRSGHTIILDDTQGSEEITIIDKTGNNKIILHSPDNSMQIKIEGNLTIEAKGTVTIKGTAGVEMSSDAALSIKGMSSTVEGSTGTVIKNGSGAQIAMSGPSVNINNGALEVT